MINNRSGNDLPLLSAHHTKGMAHQVGLAGLVPSTRVAALSCASSVLTRTGVEVEGLGHSGRRDCVDTDGRLPLRALLVQALMPSCRHYVALHLGPTALGLPKVEGDLAS